MKNDTFYKSLHSLVLVQYRNREYNGKQFTLFLRNKSKSVVKLLFRLQLNKENQFVKH